MRRLSFALLFLTSTTAFAQDVAPGDYICTVHQKAGISKLHLENAGPPTAFTNGTRTRFALSVRKLPKPLASGSHRAEELPYAGPGQDQGEWHSPNSVLHGAYVGDGTEFKATSDQGFLRLGPNASGGIWFYHSGFEYPGGVDTNLSVRYGTCALSPARRGQ